VTSVVQGYLPIPDGYVAFTIPTSEQEGVGGYVAPGDYLDVIATLNTSIFGAKTPKTVTKTIFTNLYVVRVGPQVAPAEGRPGGVSSSLTVIINSCDAEMWSWLLQTKLASTGNSAILRYELRSYKNYPPTTVPGQQDTASPSPAAAASPATSGSTGATGTGASASGTATTATSCPLGGTTGIGAKQVDARFGFSKI
jgi:Flp pilus assembly protein CpaB